VIFLKAGTDPTGAFLLRLGPVPRMIFS
jgi:hypothetical protein